MDKEERAIYRALLRPKGSLPPSLISAPEAVRQAYTRSLEPGCPSMNDEEAGRRIKMNEELLAKREQEWGTPRDPYEHPW